MRQYHVGIAAEAFAAAVFAQAGCDVLVQYGANQPGYDLMITRGGSHRKVSVKGSKDGGWGLVASYKNSDRTYHEAIDAWLVKHDDPEVIYCFVQFKRVQLSEMPRIYLASPQEAARYMKKSRGGHGYTSLRENYTWASGLAGGSKDTIPASWCFSADRLNEYLSPGEDTYHLLPADRSRDASSVLSYRTLSSKKI